MTDVPRDRPRGGKGGDRNAAARARAQARRDAIIKAERRRRLGFLGIGGVVGLVVILIVVFVAINISDKNSGGKKTTGDAPPAVTSALSSIPESAFQQVGTTGLGTDVTGLSAINGGTPVTTDGHPTFIYVGADFCPYCAAQRWAVVAALARFGSFTGLDIGTSSGTDAYPNTATLSFVDTKFTSQYVAFSGTEFQDRAGKMLDTPPAAELASFKMYSGNAYPFMSLNNQYLGKVQFLPTVLKGLTAEQIATEIKDPSTAVSKQVLAAANVLTAGICKTTDQQPSAVCSASEVTAAAKYLDTAGTNTNGSSAGGS